MVQGYIGGKTHNKTKHNNPGHLFHCIKVKRLKQEQKIKIRLKHTQQQQTFLQISYFLHLNIGEIKFN